MPRGTSLVDEARLQGRLWHPRTLNPSLMFTAKAEALEIISGDVATAYDQSGFARNATAAGSARPAFTTRNGGAINVTTGKLLSLASRLTFSGDLTLFTLMEANGGDIFVPFDTSDSAPTGGVNIKYMWFSGWGQYWTNLSGTLPIVSTSMSGVLTQVIRRSSTSGSFWEKGNRTNFTANATACNINDVAGSRQTNISTNHYLMTALAFNRALSDKDVANVQGWMAWDRRDSGFVQSQLPANHPFRNRPPLIGD
jgi:Tfp pilus assembly major pilin PilA